MMRKISLVGGMPLIKQTKKQDCWAICMAIMSKYRYKNSQLDFSSPDKIKSSIELAIKRYSDNSDFWLNAYINDSGGSPSQFLPDFDMIMFNGTSKNINTFKKNLFNFLQQSIHYRHCPVMMSSERWIIKPFDSTRIGHCLIIYGAKLKYDDKGAATLDLYYLNPSPLSFGLKCAEDLDFASAENEGNGYLKYAWKNAECQYYGPNGNRFSLPPADLIQKNNPYLLKRERTV